MKHRLTGTAIGILSYLSISAVWMWWEVRVSTRSHSHAPTDDAGVAVRTYPAPRPKIDLRDTIDLRDQVELQPTPKSRAAQARR